MATKLGERIPCSGGCDGAFHAKGETPFPNCNRTKVAKLEAVVEAAKNKEHAQRNNKPATAVEWHHKLLVALAALDDDYDYYRELEDDEIDTARSIRGMLYP